MTAWKAKTIKEFNERFDEIENRLLSLSLKLVKFESLINKLYNKNMLKVYME